MKIIENKRLMEVTRENQSCLDFCRWRIAKKDLDGVRMKGLEYTYRYDTEKYIFTLKNAEGDAKTFLDHYYYLPIGVNHVPENSNFVENPRYQSRIFNLVFITALRAGEQKCE